MKYFSANPQCPVYCCFSTGNMNPTIKKYLAWQLKKKRENKMVNKIVEDEREMMDQQGIKRVFLKFNVKLFKKQEIDIKNIQKYSERSDLPKVTEDVTKLLNQPITSDK